MCCDDAALALQSAIETNIMNLLSTLLFKAGLPTIPHNLPLQIDNTNLYQPTFNMTMCSRISFWGKNDHF